MKKICVVTGTRAEFGLLKQLLVCIKSSIKLRLQLIVTGSHLSPKFGMTKNEILDCGFKIDAEVDMQLGGDSPKNLTASIAIGIDGMTKAFSELKPDLVLVLGDRYELLCVVIPALFNRIPIGHIHGGERTEGLMDETIRHSVTKFAHLHFVAHEEYRRRVIQLGENPSRVFTVGGLGIDAIDTVDLFSREELEESLDFKFQDRNLMVTFHPVTLDPASARTEVLNLLNCLGKLERTGIIFTMPNADADNDFIAQKIKDFCEGNENAKWFDSIGQQRYLSCLNLVDGVVGNSSSGLLEAPSFGVGTVNIGDRQKGRIAGDSVIHCGHTMEEIDAAIHRLFDPSFQETLGAHLNPYGSPGASQRILELLEKTEIDRLLDKQFFDVVT